MKRVIASILLCGMLTGLTASENEEFRAVWVITWEHISGSRTTEQNMARVRQILDNVKAANMNAVLWQVRQSGTAYYNSSYEPWGYYAGYEDPGYDPLAYAIEEAHKRGLELHAWFNVFQVSNSNNTLDPLPPAVAHPDWVCRDSNGNPMPAHQSFSPGLQAVRDYTVEVAMEIVRNYDIDGFHLDYVRYNEYTTSSILSKPAATDSRWQELDGMISEEEIENLVMQPTNRYLWDVDHPYSGGIPNGYDSWEDFWRWSVTEFVRTLHDSIQAVKPYVRLSPALLGKYNWSGWNGYNVVFQDGAHWFNQGYIDQITGMHYHWLTPEGFYDMLVDGCPECWGQYIQDGINDDRLYSVGPGSYRFDQEGVWNNHPAVINKVREVPWVDGFQFFSYGSWRNNYYWEQASNTFFERKTKIRAASYMLQNTPDAPVISGTKIDSFHFDITVTPDAGINANQWFALYRSEDDQLSVDADDILDIRFGQNEFTFRDSISGFQNFDGRYTYFATMLDRVWNESAVSNSFVSDSIPSFFPQVLATIPVEGDTMYVIDDLIFQFSKQMDVTSFTDHVSILPSVEIEALEWSDKNTVLTISFSSRLEFSTDYTLTIDGQVTDMISKPLDGNGDGTGGDDFILSFVTKDRDDRGPLVQFSHPPFEPREDYFDVDDIVVMAFDELLKDSTVNENTVTVHESEYSIPNSAAVFNYGDGQSLIAVEPHAPFEPAREYMVKFHDSITDTTGNPLDTTIALSFDTRPFVYLERKMIDAFYGAGSWWAPWGSGSTVGIIAGDSYFRITDQVYLPYVSRPLDESSAELHYVWDPDSISSGGSILLREYLAGGTPKDVTFDTTYVLQCYVFGDGSGNLFRFAVDDNHPRGWGTDHEVSPWYTLDWVGWKLINWQLNDDETGEWLGDGRLDGTLRFDSFQLTYAPGAAQSGTLFFRDLRVTKNEYNTVGTIADNQTQPIQYQLNQNYPNPFNAQTKIKFSISQPGPAKLVIYDILGRRIKTLVDENLQRGEYSLTVDFTGMATGIYIYELQSSHVRLHKKMMLIK